MKKDTFKQYRFDKFRVDSRSCSLYFDDELVRDINKKSLQVLIALLEKPKTVVSHEEIIERVWCDNYHGVTSNNIAQYVLKLRKTLAKFQPQKLFIGTDTKRGYIFEEDVITENETVVAEDEASENTNSQNSDIGEVIEDLPLPTKLTEYVLPRDNVPSRKTYRLKLFIPLAALMLIAVSIAAVNYFSVSDEEQVRRVVKESQMYESLVLYANPTVFDENDLRKYWIDEPNVGDVDIIKVRNGVKNLVSKNVYYGKESKCEKFDFVSVDVNETRDYAVVKTIEKWFVAKYRTDGTLIENKTIGPYSITYHLRKVKGNWLIEKSSTVRAGG